MAKQFDVATSKAGKKVNVIDIAATVALHAKANSVLDNGVAVITADMPKGGVSAVIKMADKGKGAMHTIALGLMLGEVKPEHITDVAFPRSLKNEKTYIGKLSAYVVEHGAPALRDAWNAKVVERSREVSLAGLIGAIKPTATKDATTKPSASKTVGNSDDTKTTPDEHMTIAAIKAILAQTTTAERKLDQIGKLAAFKTQDKPAVVAGQTQDKPKPNGMARKINSVLPAKPAQDKPAGTIHLHAG